MLLERATDCIAKAAAAAGEGIATGDAAAGEGGRIATAVAVGGSSGMPGHGAAYEALRQATEIVRGMVSTLNEAKRESDAFQQVRRPATIHTHTHPGVVRPPWTPTHHVPRNPTHYPPISSLKLMGPTTR